MQHSNIVTKNITNTGNSISCISNSSNTLLTNTGGATIGANGAFANHITMEGVSVIPDTDVAVDSACSMQAVANTLERGVHCDILSLLEDIPRLALACPDGISRYAIPVLCAKTPEWPPELQLVAARIMHTIISHRTMPPPTTVTRLIALCAARVVLPLSGKEEEEKNNEEVTGFKDLIREAFGDTLAVTLPVTVWSESDCSCIVELVDSFTASPASLDRLLAAKALHGLSSSECPAPLIDATILPRLWCLLSDRDSAVRAHVVGTLCMLCRRITTHAFYDRLWPKIVRLWDVTQVDGSNSRPQAVVAVAQLLTHDNDIRFFSSPNQFYLSSLFQHVCLFTHTHGRDNVHLLSRCIYECLVAIATHISAMMTRLAAVSATNWHKQGLRAFTLLANCDDTTIRSTCAQSLSFVCAAFRGKFTSAFIRLAQSMCVDTDPDVRCAFAQSFVQTFPLLASHSTGSVLRRIFQAVLDDHDDSVLVACIDSLGVILKLFGALKGSRASKLHLGVALKRITTLPDWRLRVKTANQLSIAAKRLMPSQHHDVIMFLLSLFRDKVVAVRKAAGRSFLRVVRTVRAADKRWQYISFFFDEFCSCECSTRVSVVEMLYSAIDVFSTFAFRTMFAAELLHLSADPVSNVRLKVAKQLHKAAPACYAMPRFSDVVLALRGDVDTDVRHAMLGYAERAARWRGNRRFARRDAKKLEFERWWYGDHFSPFDPTIANANESSAHAVGGSTYPVGDRSYGVSANRRVLSRAISKMRRVFWFPRVKKRSCMRQEKRRGDMDTSTQTLTDMTPNSSAANSNSSFQEQDRVTAEDFRDYSADRVDDLSLSTTSFNEITMQWRYSSDDGSVATCPNLNISEDVDVDHSKQPLSLPLDYCPVSSRSSPVSVTSFLNL